MQKKSLQIPDPRRSATEAHLVYVNCGEAGYTRLRAGKGFRYLDKKGRTVKDAKILKRIRSLVLPPAWKGVWICVPSNGHLQATGFDVKGRKQYRYHPRWNSVRGQTKYEKILFFGRKLPEIRQKIRKDLRLRGLPKEKILATVVRLLEVSLIRVGNEEYARDNQSFGLATMKDRHAKVKGKQIHFHFRGKSGVEHSIDINDPRVAKIVKSCQEIPGQDLFQYVDHEGRRHPIRSCDVNDYLHRIAGEQFTAKDFRTWAGTVLAAQALREFEKFDSKAQANRNVVRAIESVANKLGNTKAVCKKCYIHPAVLDSYLDGTLIEMLTRKADAELKSNLSKLKPEEAAVLAFLHHSLGEQRATRAA